MINDNQAKIPNFIYLKQSKIVKSTKHAFYTTSSRILVIKDCNTKIYRKNNVKWVQFNKSSPHEPLICQESSGKGEKMIKQQIRKPKVQKRHQSLRVNLEGTTEFPRLAVYRSTKHIYAQLIDDEKHVTICSASSLDKDLKDKLKHGGNIEAAKLVGEAIAKKALKAGVECVVFDRGGFLYHGRVQALADAAREVGLQF